MEFHTPSQPPRSKHSTSSGDLSETWRPPSSLAPPSEARDLPPVFDQRADSRTEVRYPVAFALHAAPRRSGICTNLSLGGLQIRTSEIVPFGSQIDVYLQLEGIAGESRLSGTVRWSKPGLMGVQLDAHGARITHAILRMAPKDR